MHKCLALIVYLSIFTISSKLFRIPFGGLYLPYVFLVGLPLFAYPHFRRIFLSKLQYLVCNLYTLTLFLVVIYSAFISDWFSYAIKDSIKIVSFIISYSFFFALFRTTPNRNFLICLASLPIFFVSLYFTIHSLIHFSTQGMALRLVLDTNDFSDNDRNSFLFFIFIYFMLFCRAFLECFSTLSTKFRALFSGIATFFLALLFLSNSRLTFLLASIYLLTLVPRSYLARIFHSRLKLTHLLILLLLSSLACFIFFFSPISDVFSSFEVFGRLSDSLSEFHADNRYKLAAIGLDCYAEGNLFFGNGYYNFFNCIKSSHLLSELMVLHNDHLAILNNFGLVGYCLWLSFFVRCSGYLPQSKLFIRPPLHLVSCLILILFSLLFVDAYNSLSLSFLLAFFASNNDLYQRRSLNLKPIPQQPSSIS